MDILANVFKPGPDRPVRPVEPSTGRSNGPVNPFNPLSILNRSEPARPAVQPRNRRPGTGFDEPGRVDVVAFDTSAMVSVVVFDDDAMVVRIWIGRFGVFFLEKAQILGGGDLGRGANTVE